MTEKTSIDACEEQKHMMEEIEDIHLEAHEHDDEYEDKENRIGDRAVEAEQADKDKGGDE